MATIKAAGTEAESGNTPLNEKMRALRSRIDTGRNDSYNRFAKAMDNLQNASVNPVVFEEHPSPSGNALPEDVKEKAAAILAKLGISRVASIQGTPTFAHSPAQEKSPNELT